MCVYNTRILYGVIEEKEAATAATVGVRSDYNGLDGRGTGAY